MRLILLVFFMTITSGIGFATRHTITNSGFTFSPDTITINSGDTVVFTLASAHNAIEVSQETYNNNGNTSNGGFSVPFGGGSIKLTSAGNHYYVCAPHASGGMKGLIIVSSGTDIQSLSVNSYIEVYPNPNYGSFVVTNRYADIRISKIEVANNKGEIVKKVIPENRQPVVNLKGYAPGLYIVTIYTDRDVITKKVIVR